MLDDAATLMLLPRYAILLDAALLAAAAC